MTINNRKVTEEIVEVDVVKDCKLQPYHQDQAKFHLSTRTVFNHFSIDSELVFPV